MDRKILHPAIVILQGLNEVKGLKRAGIRDQNCGDLESQRVGSGSAGFFMESSSFLGSGIKIWRKNMGSVTKNIPRYDPDIMCRSTRPINPKLQHPPPSPPPPPPPPLGKARAFELLKIGSFKFPPPRAKMVFKCPTLLSDFSVIPY